MKTKLIIIFLYLAVMIYGFKPSVEIDYSMFTSMLRPMDIGSER